MGFVIWILLGGLLGKSVSALMGIRERRAIDRSVGIGIASVLFAGWLLGGLIGNSVFARSDFSLPALLVALLAAAVVLGIIQVLRIRYFHAQTQYQYETNEMNGTLRAIPGLHPLAVTGIAVTLMFLAACASAPVAPDSALDAAKVAISNAEKAEAGQFASAELGEARQKLALADGAVVEKNMVSAERFAQESRVQAELASARTAAAKAMTVNKEMERGADALSEEMQRAGEAK